MNDSPPIGRLIPSNHKVGTRLIPILLIGLALIYLYRPTIDYLFQVWSEDKEYSHGFLIPIVSMYFIWLGRDTLSSVEVKPSRMLGFGAILFSIMILAAGEAGGVPLLSAVSLLFVLPGVVLFIGGFGPLRVLLFPLAYLLFMVPWMDEIINKLHMPFQILTAKMASLFLAILQIPVLREGTVLQLPNQTLDVAPGCSGVSFLVTVIALGIPLVYLTQTSIRRAAAVILSGILIAIFTNWIRVTIAGILAIRYGSDMVHGPMHIFQGWLVSQVGLVGLFLTNWGAGRFFPPSNPLSLFERDMQSIPVPIDSKPRNHMVTSGIFLAAFLISFAAYLSLFGKPIPIPLTKGFNIGSSSIPGWTGQQSDWIPADKYFPGADNAFRYSFIDPHGNQIHLLIGYFEMQRQGKSLISYLSRPLAAKGKRMDIHTGFGGKREVLLSHPRIGGAPHVALLWYGFPNGETYGRYETKIKGVTDALIHRKNNGAVILLATPVADEEDRSIPESRLLNFAPLLRYSFPSL